MSTDPISSTRRENGVQGPAAVSGDFAAPPTAAPDEAANASDTLAPATVRDTQATPVAAAFPSTPSASATPTRLGRYRLLRKIGGGGMGEVYEARLNDGSSSVALKTLRCEVGATLSRFIGEFHTLVELRHENLVRIFELATDGPLPFLTMELVEGTDLLHWVRPTSEDGTAEVREDRLRSALRQLVEGLDFVHRAGYVHRDVKPSNVLVNHAGQLKILDFGLAADMTREGFHVASVPGAAVGTLAFMAPEQQRGESLTAAADWYSVGVLLYQCLTGKLPFTARNEYELLNLKLQGPPASLTASADCELASLCSALLSPDPSQRPGVAAIRSALGAEPSETPRAGGVRLIGRGSQLAELTAAFAEVVQERTAQLMFISGRSGMGKSEFVRTFLEDLERSGRAQVFRGRCYESVFSPYKAFEALAAALSRRLQSLSALEVRGYAPLHAAALGEVFPVFREVFASAGPSARGTSPQERRLQAFSAFRELLTRLGPFSGRLPLVLFIDDLQWGDLDSVALLAELLRPPDAPPCLLIASYRSEDRHSSPCLQALFDSDSPLLAPEVMSRARAVEIGPLPREKAEELARRTLRESGADDHVAPAVARESGGSPLFVIELAQHLRGKARRSWDPGQENAAPVSLDELIWTSVQALPADRRLLVELVAAAGRPLARETAQAAAGLAEYDPATVDALVGERFLRLAGSHEGGEWDTYHDRIREAVLGRLPGNVRCSHHRQLAIALESQAAADPEFIAQQFQAAGVVNRAGVYFLQAAEQAAAALAFDRAARLFRSALESASGADVDPQSVRVRLAEALANAGHCAEAAEQYLQAAETADRDNRLELWRSAALRYLTSGHVAEGTGVLREVLRAVGMRLPTSIWQALLSRCWWQTRLAWRGWDARSSPATRTVRETRQLDVCWSAVAGLSFTDPMLAWAFAPRNLWLAIQFGDRRHLVRALTAHTGHVAISGNRSATAVGRWLQRARDVAAGMEGSYGPGAVSLAEGIAAHLQGKWPVAWTHCDRADALLREAEVHDVAWELATARAFALWALMYAGEYAELARRQPRLLREAIERDDLYGRLNYSSTIMLAVELAADRPQEARRRLDEDDRLLIPGRFHVQHHNAAQARTILEMYCGRGDDAWQFVQDRWRRYRTSLLGRIQQTRVDFLQVQGRAALSAAANAAKPAPLLDAARRIVRRLHRERNPWADATARLIQSGIHALNNERAAAESTLHQAIRELDGVQMRLMAAAARLRLAALTSGPQRERLRAEADGVMAEQGVRNPERMTAAFAPGFRD